jgi:DNA replication and repair protein RecF
MAIKQLSLNDFRNLKSITLDFDQNYNVITGDNGSGKTSLLESIHILCQGRSFKTHHLDHCIQHGKKNFLLFAKFDGYQAGIARNKSASQVRIDGKNISRISQLVEKSPIVTIDSSCFDLLLGPPSLRREYIDWCLFHVEHLFRDIWNDFARALKQKNSLLKTHRPSKELDYWDQHLASLCEKIHSYRSSYLEKIILINKSTQDQLGITDEILIDYKPGWKVSDNVLQSIRQCRDKELKYGYSIAGSHRDIITVKVDDMPVAQVLSRGQIKRLSISLLLSQILLVKQNTNKKIIVLLDDLESELDNIAINNLIKLLIELEVQVFITNIRNHSYLIDYSQEYKMFHVEHGMIKPVKNS